MKRLVTVTFLSCALIPTVAVAGQHRDLCASVPSACEYTGPDAPVLDADVCWEETGGLTIKGAGACLEGTWPYHLQFGEVVDPVTGVVAAYRPLDNACDHPGLCVAGPAPSGTAMMSICCEWGFCVPLTEVLCDSPASYAVMCADGVSNEDGSVTCFEGEYMP